ncbi:MAG TPA: MFS transporter [Rectinemataceae bacterium]|nr:MFS transporter [Rectinemataceae bacterium]
MDDSPYRASPYRWAVLAVFMLVNFVVQILWISYAPITADAAKFYGVSEVAIGFLAMVFMIAYVPLSIPIAWLIDRWGFRRAVGFGSLLLAGFALLRGLSGSNFTLAMLATVGLAIAQPFFLNAWTKMPAHWCLENERATAVGLITLSNLLGIAGGMVLTPMLTATMSIASAQLLYAGAAVFSALVFIAVAREYPKVPVGPARNDEKALMLDGLKHAMAVPSFRLYLIIVFVGMGLFNGVTTWIEEIVRSRGFGASEAGTFGALLLVGGIVGAVVIPALSDKTGRRRPWIFAAFLASVPGLIGMTFEHSFWPLAISAFFLGFFLTGGFPVGMQYSVEITKPTPEGTSNGLIQLFGQVSVVFVYFMQVLRSPSGAFTTGLLVSAALVIAGSSVVAFMKEPKREFERERDGEESEGEAGLEAAQ